MPLKRFKSALVVLLFGALLIGCSSDDDKETSSNLPRSSDGSAITPEAIAPGIQYLDRRVGSCSNARRQAEMSLYSHYRFTTTTAGSYTITLSDQSLTQEVYLFILKDGEMLDNGYAINQSGNGQTLTITLEANTAYDLRVYNHECRLGEVFYTLEVTPPVTP